MTKERREEVVFVAVAVSVALHIGLMVLVRPKVMTHVVTEELRHSRHPPMRVERAEPRPKALGISAMEDLQALKDAPAPAADAVPVSDVT